MSQRRRQSPNSKASASGRASIERDALFAARSLVDRMRTMYRELERMTDTPITVHRALACIGENPGLRASELATRLGMQRPAVSHVLKGLAARGWVERRRHAGDQRSIQIHVTAEGEQILRATGGRAVGTLQRAVRSLELDELRQLAVGLAALLARLPEPTSSQSSERASAVARRPSAAPRARVPGRP